MKQFNPEQALLKAKREFGEHGGVAPSIERSSTFTVMESKGMPDIFSGAKGPEKGGCFLYSRHFNPTVNILSRYLAAIESTESAMCTASGMSAISSALLQLCEMGDHIVSSDTVYGGTHALLLELFPKMGIHTTFVDIGDIETVKAAITDRTKAIFTETISNPTLKLADLSSLSTIAHSAGAKLVVDNTFLPMVVTPAALGADIVVYSMTKFINGSSDLIAGAVCGTKDFINGMMDLHTGRIMLLGPTMDPRVAFDIIQRIPHLPIRMREHGRRALSIANALESEGAKVIYPGLESYKQHGLFCDMANSGYGYGGIIALDMETEEKADQLIDILQNEENFGFIAVSLGYFDTLMSVSGVSTSSEISEEEQERIGLSPGLLRLAIGYTGSLAERVDQMLRAFRRVK